MECCRLPIVQCNILKIQEQEGIAINVVTGDRALCVWAWLVACVWAIWGTNSGQVSLSGLMRHKHNHHLRRFRRHAAAPRKSSPAFGISNRRTSKVRGGPWPRVSSVLRVRVVLLPVRRPCPASFAAGRCRIGRGASSSRAARCRSCSGCTTADRCGCAK